MDFLLGIVITILVAAVTKFLIGKYTKLAQVQRWADHVPGPLFIGHIRDFDTPTKIINTCIKYQQYGKCTLIKLTDLSPFVLITDLKFAEFLLTSNDVIKSSDYDVFRKWLNDSILLTEGQKWRNIRKIIVPAFHFKILDTFMDTFNNSTETLVNVLTKTIGNPINIDSYLRLYTLEIICATSLGRSEDMLTHENSAYENAIMSLLNIIAIRSFHPLKTYDWYFKFTEDYREEDKCVQIIHNEAYDIIKQRREEMKNRKSEISNNDQFGSKIRKPFLDVLLEANLNDDEIRKEVDTIMFAGHDTTSTSLGFTLHCLAHNPEIQENVVDELRNIFKDDKNRKVTQRDLNDMKYLEMVIKESLRMYPPVPFLSREAKAPVKYEQSLIPTGVPVVVFVYGIHMDPDNYPEPEKFIPERFSSENQAKRNPYCYLPFSAGPRNCLGFKFAIMEMKVALANLLRNFKIMPVPGHEIVLSYQLVLKSDTGILVNFRKRDF